MGRQKDGGGRYTQSSVRTHSAFPANPAPSFQGQHKCEATSLQVPSSGRLARPHTGPVSSVELVIN